MNLKKVVYATGLLLGMSSPAYAVGDFVVGGNLTQRIDVTGSGTAMVLRQSHSSDTTSAGNHMDIAKFKVNGNVSQIARVDYALLDQSHTRNSTMAINQIKIGEHANIRGELTQSVVGRQVILNSSHNSGSTQAINSIVAR